MRRGEGVICLLEFLSYTERHALPTNVGASSFPFETYDDQHRLYRMRYGEFDPTDYSPATAMLSKKTGEWKNDATEIETDDVGR